MERRSLLFSTYLFNFFVTAHVALFVYVVASILGQFVPTKGVGIIFSLGALLSVPVLVYLPRLLRNAGDIRFTFLTLIVEVVALYMLTHSNRADMVILAALIHLIILRILTVDLDVILETLSKNGATGKIRGIYMTIGNAAFVISPIIVGLLLKDTDMYSRIFWASMGALVPAFLILLFSFKHFKDPHYAHAKLTPALKTLWKRPPLRRIFLANFLLRVFYAVMVVYLGLYLHQNLHMPWSDIGIIFSIMLLPFALIEYPLGRLADTVLGEKEILCAGFFLAAVTTALIPWIQSTSVFVWATVLFLTRVGAAAIEIMTETYFFKHITKEDVEMVSLYRIVDPVAYLIAPFCVSIALSFIDIRFIFLTLGTIMLLGLWPTLRLRDTK